MSEKPKTGGEGEFTLKTPQDYVNLHSKGWPTNLRLPSDPDGPAARILEAARELFAEKGYDGASTREIAEHAQVNQAMIHYYYSNKRTLYKSMIAFNMHRLFGVMAQFFNEQNKASDILVNFPFKIMDILHENPPFRNLMLRELANGGEIIRELVVDLGLLGPLGLRQMLTVQFNQGVEQGELRDLPLDHIVQFIIPLAYSVHFFEPFFKMIIGNNLDDVEEWKRRGETFKMILKHGLFAREDDV